MTGLCRCCNPSKWLLQKNKITLKEPRTAENVSDQVKQQIINSAMREAETVTYAGVVDIECIAEALDEYSGAELNAVAKYVAMVTLRKLLATGASNPEIVQSEGTSMLLLVGQL